jgi:hypothetical protein
LNIPTNKVCCKRGIIINKYITLNATHIKKDKMKQIWHKKVTWLDISYITCFSEGFGGIHGTWWEHSYIHYKLKI